MDVVEVLNTLQSMHLVRLHRQTNNYMQVYCPFHNDGNERKPSCGVLLHDEIRNGTKYPAGWWHCFSCQTALTMEDAVTRILKDHSITSKSGLDWLKENVPGFEPNPDFEYLVSSETISALTNKFAVDYIHNFNKPAKQYVSEEELAKYRFTVPYMYERKLTDEVIEAYDIGYDGDWIPPGRKKKVPCITFPVRDMNRRTLFLCRRSIQGKLFNYPEGVQKPLYGAENISKNCKILLICESCLDALAAVTWGYDAVALLGTGNPYQIQQLKELGIPQFAICTDGDDAGRRAADRLRNALSSVAIVWRVNIPDGEDVNSLDKETFDKLFRERE